MPDASDGSSPGAGYLGITRRPTLREWRRALAVFGGGTIVLVLLLLFIHPQPSLLAVGTAAPSITLTAATGEKVSVAQAAAGHPYVVEFFEAGCAHCQQVAAQVCAEPIAVFAVDAAKDSAAAITTYRNTYAPQCSAPLLVDPTLTAASAFGVNVVPTVYVVKDGRIAFAGAGLDGVEALDGAVRKATGG